MKNLQSGDKILLVVEGKNTEPIYFEELKKFYAKIKGRLTIISQGNPDINAMINTARKNLSEGKKSRRKSLTSPLGFDRACIVLDRDHFANEPGGLRKLADAINSIGNTEKITVVLSSPCFEYWLFLHFHKERPGNPKDMLSKLEKTLKNQKIIPLNSNCLRMKSEQETEQMMHKLIAMDRTKVACDNSKWSSRQCSELNLWEKDPHTCMHELIDSLELFR